MVSMAGEPTNTKHTPRQQHTQPPSSPSGSRSESLVAVRPVKMEVVQDSPCVQLKTEFPSRLGMSTPVLRLRLTRLRSLLCQASFMIPCEYQEIFLSTRKSPCCVKRILSLDKIRKWQNSSLGGSGGGYEPFGG